MRLIDDSPALFLTICFVVVYAVIGVEAAMWIAPSVAFVALTFVLIAAIAGALCAWMFRVLSDDDAPVAVEAAAPAPQPVPTPAAAPAPARRPRALIPA
jgi:hypothetical protein